MDSPSQPESFSEEYGRFKRYTLFLRKKSFLPFLPNNREEKAHSNSSIIRPSTGNRDLREHKPENH